jgi:hypothetical protein
MNVVFFAIGAFAPKLNGYGNWTDFGIGVGILFGSLLLYFFRRVVQDKEKIHWREDTPAVPDAAELAELGLTAAPSPAMAG